MRGPGRLSYPDAPGYGSGDRRESMPTPRLPRTPNLPSPAQRGSGRGRRLSCSQSLTGAITPSLSRVRNCFPLSLS